jgi:hypothetical protein
MLISGHTRAIGAPAMSPSVAIKAAGITPPITPHVTSRWGLM